MFKYMISLLFGLIFQSIGDDQTMKIPSTNDEAIFAMGCFWCGAAAFADHDTNIIFPGIVSVKSGYTGGESTSPTYQSHEGHHEAIKVTFDPAVISFEKLLNIFWHNIDPFDNKGQFCDKGFPYTSVIYYTNDKQKETSLSSKKATQQGFSEKIVTEIIPASAFYDAEEYHQNYKKKNPIRYNFYRWNCGRDKRLNEIWGKEHPIPLPPAFDDDSSV